MDWRKHVRTALDGRHPGLGHRVELGLHALILYSALEMGVETLPHLPGWARTALSASEAVVVAVFTLEYVLRLATAPAPGATARSFFGIVDLLAIAPFTLGLAFIGIGIDLRAVRALRLLRLVRLLKLARDTSAIDRLRGRAEMLLLRPSDGGFSASGAHAPNVRCAPVLETTASRLASAHVHTASGRRLARGQRGPSSSAR